MACQTKRQESGVSNKEAREWRVNKEAREWRVNKEAREWRVNKEAREWRVNKEAREWRVNKDRHSTWSGDDTSDPFCAFFEATILAAPAPTATPASALA